MLRNSSFAASADRELLEGSSRNYENFLEGLETKVAIYRTADDHVERFCQLTNKTNQFNLNGLRLSKIKFNNILKNGGKIFSGTYSDKSGDYGEIIALLMDKNSNVISYVMSCRVFQRNIEFAFIYFLIKNKIIIKKFNFKKTSMNLPMQDFFTKIFNKYLSNDQIFINKNHYLINFKKLMSNFRVKFHKNLKS